MADDGGGGRCSPRLPAEASALLCTFADYVGLSMLTPALPFFLAELGVVDVELWVGAILSAQYLAVVIFNPIWGMVADRFGAQRALLGAMVGDTLFFGLTAVATVPGALVAVRFLAGGCSPLVPALSLIFSVLTPEKTAQGIGRYSLAICGGYVIGASTVGALYRAVGFAGLQLTSAAVAAIAAVYTALSPHGKKPLGQEAQVSGVRTALRSRHFAVYAATQFFVGWCMNMAFAVVTIALRGEFGWSVAEVGYCFLGIAAVLAVQFSYAVPALVGRLGIERVIALALIGLCAPSAVLASPARTHSGLVLCAIVLFHFVAFTALQLPATGRARVIASRYTQNGTGAITGVGRTFFALGQALSPAASLALYALVSPAAPWLVNLALIATLAAMHIATGVWPGELRAQLPPRTHADADQPGGASTAGIDDGDAVVQAPPAATKSSAGG